MKVNEGTEMAEFFSVHKAGWKKNLQQSRNITILKINVSFPIHKHLFSPSIIFMIPNAIHKIVICEIRGTVERRNICYR